MTCTVQDKMETQKSSAVTGRQAGEESNTINSFFPRHVEIIHFQN